MLKNVKKGKILLSLIASILMVVLCGNLYSFATEENTSNTPVTITPTTSGNNTQSGTNNTANNTENRASIIATGNNTTNNTNIANTNNTANNASVYNNTSNTSNSTGLPYTGTNSKAMLLIVVFALSAVYAYKKVSDYNV